MHKFPFLAFAPLLWLASFSVHAQTFNVLAAFNGSDGQTPAAPNGAGLVQGPDGNFYGITGAGGNQTCGVIYQVMRNGTLNVLHNFNYSVDGCDAASGLILGSDGDLYGATQFTIFKMSLSGAFTLLYTAPSGGPHLINALVQASDGNFYGSSPQGGTGNGGTIFKITPTGTLTVLANLSTANAVGGSPLGPLIQASDGNLYGTTSAGGVGSTGGTVFKMTLGGAMSVVYSFCVKSGCPDGKFPKTGLIQASDGNLYGTTVTGGSTGNGTIFKVTPGGSLTTLYSFCPQTACTDGNTPGGSLLQGKDGNFYGTTTYGGSFSSAGTLFRVTPAGVLTTLHQFCSQNGCTDGMNPAGSLIQTSDGTLWGTTYNGGMNDFGVVFGLAPPPPPAYTCTNTAPVVISSVDSASAYGGYSYFASGSWLEIKGSNLADPNDPRIANGSGQWASSDFNGPNAPTNLDGISVNINGKPAYVWYLSPGQLNVQAPEDSASGNVAITVTNCEATSSQVMFSRRALAPGLLAPSNYTSGGTQYMVATFQSDGAYVLNTSLGASFGLTSRPAKPGDVIIAYGVGFGDVTPSILPGTIVSQANQLVNPVTVSFGSAPATLTYWGLAGSFVGLYEFYITVPSGLSNGDYKINVAQNGTALPQTMYLTVQN